MARSGPHPLALRAVRAAQSGNFVQAARLAFGAGRANVSDRVRAQTQPLIRQAQRTIARAAQQGVKSAKAALGIKPEKKPRMHRGPVTAAMLAPGDKSGGGEFHDRRIFKRGKKGGLYYVDANGKKVYVKK